MDQENQKRMKIKIGILCSVVALFVITGVIYALTLHTYLKEDTVPTEPAEIVSEVPETVPPEKTPEETPGPTDIPEKMPTSFQEICTQTYAEEMEQTGISYLSDTTYIAIFQNEWNGHPYTLAHIVVAFPSQIKTVVSTEKRLSTRLYDEENAILAMSASMMSGHFSFIDGLHITDTLQISNQSDSTGTELACDTEGNLYKLTPDHSLNDVRFTVLSTAPLLIQNSKPVEIPEAYQNSTRCKSAIGYTVPGEYYFLTASDGDYINNITYKDIQDILLENKCTFAQSLTTDINVAMAFEGELVNQPAEKSGRTQYEYLIVQD